MANFITFHVFYYKSRNNNKINIYELYVPIVGHLLTFLISLSSRLIYIEQNNTNGVRVPIYINKCGIDF